MTIHASKGLDFQQVYLPQVIKAPRRDEEDEVAAREVDGAWELRLFCAADPRWRVLREQERVKAGRLV